MFGSVGAPELILIFIIALLIFGPRKLPELGRALGRGINEFRKATTDLKVTLEREIAEQEDAGPAPSTPHDTTAVSDEAIPPASQKNGADRSA